jgi:hypothetical protein
MHLPLLTGLNPAPMHEIGKDHGDRLNKIPAPVRKHRNPPFGRFGYPFWRPFCTP